MCGQDSEKNCVHGSDSLLSAQREISFFFEDVSSGYINILFLSCFIICNGVHFFFSLDFLYIESLRSLLSLFIS